MNLVTNLHEQAMESAELADLAKRQGNADLAILHFRRAMELEIEAANLVQTDDEPTRSILYRSAATLALDCNLFREAERLAAIGLTGNPPSEMADELRDVIDRANFERHLDLHGIVLQAGQVQLSLAGKAVAAGIVLTEAFVQRVKDIEQIFIRTVERLNGQKFRESGPPKKSIVDVYSTYILAPRPSSFAVTIQLGVPKESAKQLELPNFNNADDIIDDVMSNLALLNAGELETLQNRIEQPAYYRSFVALGKRLAPDGENISMVGFTRVRNNEEERINLVRRQSDIQVVNEIKELVAITHREPIEIIGTLKFADAIDREDRIKIVDLNGKRQTVLVPEGLMNDIVRPLWDYTVRIRGYREGKYVRLIDIERMPEAEA